MSCNFQISFQKENGERRGDPAKSLFKIARQAEFVENSPEQDGV
jgi:uncharacterized protein (DUF2461 family)